MGEFDHLPARMTTSEVCALARYKSRDTLHQRRKSGAIKLEPVDRGWQGELLWLKSEVLPALGLSESAATTDAPRPVTVSPDKIKAARAAQTKRGRPKR